VKLIPPDSAPSGYSGRGRPVSARNAAAEKEMARYLSLSCGHFTDREMAVLFSVFAENIRDIYCWNCDKFVKLTAARKPATYPDNPLF
jgi:hypothetical protein